MLAHVPLAPSHLKTSRNIFSDFIGPWKLVFVKKQKKNIGTELENTNMVLLRESYGFRPSKYSRLLK